MSEFVVDVVASDSQTVAPSLDTAQARPHNPKVLVTLTQHCVLYCTPHIMHLDTRSRATPNSLVEAGECFARPWSDWWNHPRSSFHLD